MARPANAMAEISRDSPVGVALRDALAVPALAGARVVAGAAGLDRVVQSANVMEVPDILPWVKPHELLFTTGYPLRESPDAWVGLVAALDDRGLAGLRGEAAPLRRRALRGDAGRGRAAGVPGGGAAPRDRLRRRADPGAHARARPPRRRAGTQ
jgi:hypothetical protein